MIVSSTARCRYVDGSHQSEDQHNKLLVREVHVAEYAMQMQARSSHTSLALVDVLRLNFVYQQGSGVSVFRNDNESGGVGLLQSK